MDIGTAKPSAADQAKVPHNLLDIVEPNESFNVADFKTRTEVLIAEINARGRLPIMVGGTGLYIDSVLFNYELGKTERSEKNLRHAKESKDPYARGMRDNTLVLGMEVAKAELEDRIERRVAQMFVAGLEDEVERLVAKYGWEPKAMSGVGYREWRAYLDGKQSLEDTAVLIAIHTRQYAKRQRTWFKRNTHTHWFEDATSALAFAENWVIEKSSSGQNSTITTDA
jgi:tRNA dimethylallyltransferase